MSVTANYTVTGMTCGHCEASVREEIEEIAGVESVKADRTRNSVEVVSAEPIDQQAVIDAVKEAGYEAAPASA